jgi:hypothetical protein
MEISNGPLGGLISGPLSSPLQKVKGGNMKSQGGRLRAVTFLAGPPELEGST